LFKFILIKFFKKITFGVYSKQTNPDETSHFIRVVKNLISNIKTILLIL